MDNNLLLINYGGLIRSGIPYSRDLAAQLQQADEAASMAPPTTPEEYERAAVEYHHRTQSHKDPSCIVL